MQTDFLCTEIMAGFAGYTKQMSGLINDLAKKKGWWDNQREDGTVLALVHSEVTEALEVLRNPSDYPDEDQQKDHLAEELADVVIRVLDFAEYKDIDLGKALVAKHKKNCDRPHMHGGKKF